MEILLKLQNKFSGECWTEYYIRHSITTLTNAKRWAKEMIAEFNASAEKDSQRKLLEVFIVTASKPAKR